MRRPPTSSGLGAGPRVARNRRGAWGVAVRPGQAGKDAGPGLNTGVSRPPHQKRDQEDAPQPRRWRPAGSGDPRADRQQHDLQRAIIEADVAQRGHPPEDHQDRTVQRRTTTPRGGGGPPNSATPPSSGRPTAAKRNWSTVGRATTDGPGIGSVPSQGRPRAPHTPGGPDRQHRHDLGQTPSPAGHRGAPAPHRINARDATHQTTGAARARLGHQQSYGDLAHPRRPPIALIHLLSPPEVPPRIPPPLPPPPSRGRVPPLSPTHSARRPGSHPGGRSRRGLGLRAYPPGEGVRALILGYVRAVTLSAISQALLRLDLYILFTLA